MQLSSTAQALQQVDGTVELAAMAARCLAARTVACGRSGCLLATLLFAFTSGRGGNLGHWIAAAMRSTWPDRRMCFIVEASAQAVCQKDVALAHLNKSSGGNGVVQRILDIWQATATATVCQASTSRNQFCTAVTHISARLAVQQVCASIL